MPVFDAEDRGCPQLNDKQLKEVMLLDKLNIDVGWVYENDKGEKRRVERIIYPAGAFCRTSEVLKKYKSNGHPKVWRTVDADGPRCDINWVVIGDDTKKGQTGPDEWKKWLGASGKPKSFYQFVEPEAVGSAKVEEILNRATRAAELNQAKIKAKQEDDFAAGK